MADLLFSGGPCSGRHQTIPDDFTATGIRCGGMNYKMYQVEPGYWLGLPPSHAPPQTTVTVSSPRAGHAWHRLVHTMKRNVPDNIRRSQAARRRMLRIGRK